MGRDPGRLQLRRVLQGGLQLLLGEARITRASTTTSRLTQGVPGRPPPGDGHVSVRPSGDRHDGHLYPPPCLAVPSPAMLSSVTVAPALRSPGAEEAADPSEHGGRTIFGMIA